jgi:large subunit ribosomal protein L10
MKNDNTKISQNRQKKEVIVAELVAKIDKAQGIVFANYQGLTHQQLETLKKTVKKFEAEFVAAKNTLLLRSLEGKVDLGEQKEQFKKPTGALFIYNDIVEPLKELAKTIKALKLPEIKFGILEGKVITDKDVLKLASLPPLSVLRAQLLGQMNAPISGLHRALNWNLQQLVLTLNAIKEKKA